MLLVASETALKKDWIFQSLCDRQCQSRNKDPTYIQYLLNDIFDLENLYQLNNLYDMLNTFSEGFVVKETLFSAGGSPCL